MKISNHAAMNDKINYREKVPCFGNQPAADIELLKKVAEADHRRNATIKYLQEHCGRVETMVFTMCVCAIVSSFVAIGYFLYLIIQQLTK